MADAMHKLAHGPRAQPPSIAVAHLESAPTTFNGPGIEGADQPDLDAPLLRMGSSGVLYRAFDRVRDAIAVVTAFLATAAILPNSALATGWRLLAMGAAVAQSILIPYQVAFAVDSNSVALTFNNAAWAILIIDIVLGFRTAFINYDGQVVAHPRAMAVNYLRSRFILDVVANFPIEVFAPTLYAHGYRSLRLNRVLSLYKAMAWIRHEEMKLTGSLLVQAYKFLLMVIMVIHYYACIWWIIGLPPATSASISSAPEPDVVAPPRSAFLLSWLPLPRGASSPSTTTSSTTTTTTTTMTWSMYDPNRHNSVDLHAHELDDHTSIKYVYSAYWVLNILTVPGYADLEAPNFQEKTIGLAMFLSGLILFGYVTASVTSILANRDSQRSRYQQKLLSVRQYMDHNHFDATTRKRVSAYYNYLWKRNKGIDAKTIFTDLPTTFQAELALGINGHIIGKVPLFQDTEIGFMRMLSLALQPVLFLPNEYVVKKGDIGSEMFFIHKGRVDVVSEDGCQVFASMHEGSFFGEIAFFSRPRTASIRAATYTDIYVLSKTNLEEVLAYYPAVKERILMAAQERLRENENRQRAQQLEQQRTASRPGTLHAGTLGSTTGAPNLGTLPFSPRSGAPSSTLTKTSLQSIRVPDQPTIQESKESPASTRANVNVMMGVSGAGSSGGSDSAAVAAMLHAATDAESTSSDSDGGAGRRTLSKRGGPGTVRSTSTVHMNPAHGSLTLPTGTLPPAITVTTSQQSLGGSRALSSQHSSPHSSMAASILEIGGSITADGEVTLPDSIFGMRVAHIDASNAAIGVGASKLSLVSGPEPPLPPPTRAAGLRDKLLQVGGSGLAAAGSLVFGGPQLLGTRLMGSSVSVVPALDTPSAAPARTRKFSVDSAGSGPSAEMPHTSNSGPGGTSPRRFSSPSAPLSGLHSGSRTPPSVASAGSLGSHHGGSAGADGIVTGSRVMREAPLVEVTDEDDAADNVSILPQGSMASFAVPSARPRGSHNSLPVTSACASAVSLSDDEERRREKRTTTLNR
ncbi:Kinesin-like protein kif27 [Allomyces arbusculus]|nr:Kinesin-like protein kif27 [Allomyces arbusculus]